LGISLLYKTVRTFYYLSHVSNVNRRAVAALVASEVVSILGTRMTYLALPWFVLVTTGSPAKMSIVLAAQILPMALLGIPSGSVVEKLGGRTTMLACDLARVPIMAAIPLLYAANLLSFPLLVALVALLGVFMPPYGAAQRVVLPELVGEDERLISQANSSIEGGTAFAAIIGPALAGVLIPFIGAPNVLYVDAATFLVSFLILLTLVPKRKPLRESGRRGVLAGLRFVVRDRLLGPLTATVAGFGFIVSALSAALPVFAYDAFSSRVAGLFYAALGAGALVGTIFAVFLVRRVAPLRLASFGILAFAVPLWVLPMTEQAWLVTLALFVATLFTPLVNGPVIGVLTARTPEALRPKVMAAIISLHTVAAPLGFLLAGQVLERWGVDPVFFGVAAVVTMLSLVFASITLRHDEPAPERPPVVA
jgi:predicted MFS family arabinose efflux permease